MNTKPVHVPNLVGPKGSGLFEDMRFLKEKEKEKKNIFLTSFCLCSICDTTTEILVYMRKKDLRKERKSV